MEITVKLTDDLAEHKNPGQEALEALVAEGYRSECSPTTRRANC